MSFINLAKMIFDTFSISFEKIANLKYFPEDKHTAVLQAHLTGKALKVFTELSTEEDYSKITPKSTLRKALLAAYSAMLDV